MTKAATVVIAAAAAGTVAVSLCAWSGLPTRLLADTLVSRVDRATDGRVKIRSGLELQIWPSPAVVARDVAIKESDDPDAVTVTVERVQVALAWSGLLAGAPHVTDVEVSRPQARIPMVRERRTISGLDLPSMPDGITPVVDQVVVKGGVVVLVDQKTGTEQRIERVDATIDRPTSPNSFKLDARAVVADRSVTFAAQGQGGQATRPDGVLPVEFRLDAPDLPELGGAAEVRFGDAILAVDASRIDVGPNRFSGQVSIDLGARKPFVSATLEAKTLDLAAFDKVSTKGGRPASKSWSDKDLGLDGLNQFDGEVKLSAARAVYKSFEVADVALTAKLRRGTATLSVGPTAVADGQVEGKVTVEAAGAKPVIRLQSRVDEVDLEPVMRGLADFRGFAGHASARVDIVTQGATPKSLVAALSGTASGRLHDGDIGGQDLARTVGSLAARLMTGRDPQEIGGFKINDLSGSMRFDRGQGTTEDFLLDASLVRMTGQGRIDLPRQAVAFEFKPKLSLGKAQTGLAGSIDIAVPFNVDGPWASPSVAPGNGLPTISSGDFGLLPQGTEAETGPRAQPDDIINNIGSLVSDLIANGAKAKPDGFGKAAP